MSTWNYTAYDQGEIPVGIHQAALASWKEDNGDALLTFDVHVQTPQGQRTYKKTDRLKRDEKVAFRVADLCKAYRIDYGAVGEHRSIDFDSLKGKIITIEAFESENNGKKYVNIRYNPKAQPAHVTNPGGDVPDSALPF